MDIKGKTLEEVSEHVAKVIAAINPEQPFPPTAIQASVDQDTYNALIDLLSIRSQLNERFKGVFKMIDSIEENIKAKAFPTGKYGVAYTLKITQVQKTQVHTDLIVQAIKDAKLDIQDYSILDLKNKYVEDLIKNNNQFSSKVPNYNKHTFG